jgi:hypothetical protein
VGRVSSTHQINENLFIIVVGKHQGKGHMELVCILNLGTRWRWAVSFMTLPTLDLGKESAVPVGYEVRWTSEPVWTLQKRLFPLLGMECWFHYHVTCSLQSVPTKLSQLLLLPSYSFYTSQRELIFSMDIFALFHRIPKSIRWFLVMKNSHKFPYMKVGFTCRASKFSPR